MVVSIMTIRRGAVRQTGTLRHHAHVRLSIEATTIPTELHGSPRAGRVPRLLTAPRLRGATPRPLTLVGAAGAPAGLPGEVQVAPGHRAAAVGINN